MSVLTQLFEAPTFNYSYFDNEPAIGSEDFGKAVLGAGMQFVRDSYLNTLALAQEEAMENGGTGALITDAFKMFTEMALNNAAEDNALAAHIAESSIEILDNLHEFTIKQLDQEGWLLWDDGMMVLNLETFTNRLEAAKAA
jgi:hypothetical protein